MFLDGRSLDGQSLEAELCIIGAGAAGIAMAHALDGSGMRIVVVESGGFEPDKQTLDLNEGTSTGQRYSLESTRLRWFGGSTNHWEGMCAPLDEYDFEQREWIEGSGWPFTRTELEPYYRQAAKFLDLSGTGSADFSVRQDMVPNRGTLAFGSWRFAKNLSFGRRYRKELEQSQHVRVVLHSNVVDMVLQENGQSVTRVEAMTLQKQRFSVAAQRYVLACGGIENARLLLACNRQTQQGIGNTHGNVGRFFMEHPHNNVGTLVGFGKKDLAEHFRLHFGRLRGLRPVNKDIVADTSSTVPHIALSAQAMQEHSVAGGSLVIDTVSGKVRDDPALHYISRVYGEGAPLRALGLYARTEQVPNAGSRITLSPDKRDALDIPRATLHWSLKEQDWETIHVLVRLFAEAVSAAGYGVVRMPKWLREFKGWPDHLHWGGHHMGTTRMHDDPRHGVVDANCKVHGIGNLFIAGSSVFPTSGWANPTYTLLALAFRLARHIKANAFAEK